MPIYRHQCTCGHVFDVFRNVDDRRDEEPCETCGEPAPRSWMGASAVVFQEYPYWGSQTVRVWNEYGDITERRAMEDPSRANIEKHLEKTGSRLIERGEMDRNKKRRERERMKQERSKETRKHILNKVFG